ncbi:protein trichome birefringence-like 14 [Iris pallida]|uniref:Protein trichome birefringence-like 14 n=1 Tax=Iris pallida TaxID=29817 RepID=A0AAX6E4W6_IRIPA|nr:protein trichome birefringence-like 14 [Iris pallida]
MRKPVRWRSSGWCCRSRDRILSRRSPSACLCLGRRLPLRGWERSEFSHRDTTDSKFEVLKVSLEGKGRSLLLSERYERDEFLHIEKQ